MIPWKILTRVARVLLLAILLIVMGLLALQHGLIYFPRPYQADQLAALPQGVVELTFQTDAGAQCAFYVPSVKAPPRRIWAMFAGNASVALDWLDLVARADRRDGFLLVDYPGYGKSAGIASPDTIMETSAGAAAQVAGQLGQNANDLRWGAIGHSIGGAAALQFALRQPAVERLILISPFTSLRDMARRVVGWPLCYVLLHDFDNRTALAELAKRNFPPRVTIFHGTEDEVVPFRMGNELARLHPQMITFRSVDGADHNVIVDAAESEILRALGEQ